MAGNLKSEFKGFTLISAQQKLNAIWAMNGFKDTEIKYNPKKSGCAKTGCKHRRYPISEFCLFHSRSDSSLAYTLRCLYVYSGAAELARNHATLKQQIAEAESKSDAATVRKLKAKSIKVRNQLATFGLAA